MNEKINQFDTLDDWVRRIANKTPILSAEERLKKSPHLRKLVSKLADISNIQSIYSTLNYCKNYGDLLAVSEAQSVQVTTEIYRIDDLVIEFDSNPGGYFNMSTYDAKGYLGL